VKRNLSVRIGKLVLKNPVVVASGTFGYAEEFRGFLNLKKLGAIVTKTLTLRPRQGNPPPRTCETPSGMLNSIGLENPGIEVFVKEKLSFFKRLGVPLVMSIASEEDPAEFVELAQRIDALREVGAIELNISCPNIRPQASGSRLQAKACGVQPAACSSLIAQDAHATHSLVKKVRRVTTKTLITKLSPNVTDITDIALAAEDAGTDAIALVNTLSGMCIDVEKRRAALAVTTGGLSGPAIRPMAVRMVWETYQKIRIPIIGMGGIIDTQSALEFIIAGATAVSIGTANFVDPAISQRIVEGLQAYLLRYKIKDVHSLVGALLL